MSVLPALELAMAPYEGPRLVTRKDVELGVDRRRGDATPSHLRRNESNIGDGAGGAENARRSRGRRAEEPLCHQNGRA